MLFSRSHLLESALALLNLTHPNRQKLETFPLLLPFLALDYYQ